jgi:hypothetical protein
MPHYYLDQYLAALRKYEQAEAAAQAAVDAGKALAGEASALLQDWKTIRPVFAGKETAEMFPRFMGRRIVDLTDFPIGQEIFAAIDAWQTAAVELENAWDYVPADKRVYAPPMPSIP